MSDKKKTRQFEVSFKVSLFDEKEFEEVRDELAKEKDSTFSIQEIDLGEERLIAVMGRTHEGTILL